MRPPIKKTCPECGGAKGYKEYNHDNIFWEDCQTCNGTGEVYNYLTPQQWEAETGEKWPLHEDVWEIVDHGLGETWERIKYKDCDSLSVLLVARPGQPKPDDNWRPS